MTTRSQHRVRNLTILVVVILVVAALFVLRFEKLGQATETSSIRSVQEELGIPVETVHVAVDDLAQWIDLAGTVEGVTQYPVASYNALRIVGLPMREGDMVAEGDVIVRLADIAPSAMYLSVVQARATYANQLREVQRLRNLYAEGAISKQSLDEAETRLEVAASSLQNAEGSTVLTASHPGRVSRIVVNEGDMAEAGKALVWITDTSSVKIKFNAGSNQALAMAVGQLAEWTDPRSGEIRQGRIGKLDLMADPETHLLAGEAHFANEDGRLLPGLLVSFLVRTRDLSGVLALPARCLVDHQGRDAVWLVAGDRDPVTAVLRPVGIGLRTTDRVQVTDGLAAGDEVVLHGQTLLSEDVRVNRVAATEGK